jgi:RHS repeat-associated protein
VDNDAVTNDFGYNVRSEVIGALMGTNRYSYAYDPIGNRLTATNNAEGWTYLSNPLNQYTNIADGVSVEPEYDADGNMTATGDGWRYVWNGENRMILASNATTVVTYAYDHQGRMVSKVVNGSARRYLWDGYNIVADARTACTNWFVWGLDLSGSLQGAGGVGGLLAEVKDGEPYFAASDANGNVTEYISTNGMTAAHYEYSPFGEIVVQSGDLADSFNHRFSTKPWCGVTGLSEYLFRKYEPGLGRWMSRDPIGEHGGRHLYAISRNRAANSLDPLGLCEPGEINPNSLATQNCVVHVGGEPKVNDAYDKALQSLNSLGDVEQTAEAMQLVAAYLSAGTAGALEALSSWLLKQGLGANAVGGIANNLSTFYQKRGAETQGVNLHNRVLYEECVCSFFRGWHYENRMTDWKKYVREMPGSFGNYESIADAVRDDGLARAHGLAEFRKAHGL